MLDEIGEPPQGPKKEKGVTFTLIPTQVSDAPQETIDISDGKDAGVTDDTDGEVHMTNKKDVRLFQHGLGPCPPPPDGATPFFLAAYHLTELSSTLAEADEVQRAIVAESKRCYQHRYDQGNPFAWNDAFRKNCPWNTHQNHFKARQRGVRSRSTTMCL